uniref:Uncharacterized protein n=1 Tax=Solanum lycopersicum TaxID=4081 RepID=A0A3Q7GBP3_SOLLC
MSSIYITSLGNAPKNRVKSRSIWFTSFLSHNVYHLKSFITILIPTTSIDQKVIRDNIRIAR